MRARVRRSSGSRLRKRLRAMPESARATIKQTMTEIGQELASELESKAPKDKGDLAAAARFKVSRDGLGVNVGYSNTKDGFRREWKKGGFVSLFAEFGTRHHPAKPFIRPVWKGYIRKALDKIDNSLKTTLRNLGGE